MSELSNSQKQLNGGSDQRFVRLSSGDSHEPAIAVHNVFSEAIPGAFGIRFLQSLIGKPNDKDQATRGA